MKKNNPLIHTQKYVVKGHDVNADRYITIPSLLRSMQECSLQHARQLKTSVWDMEEDHISWVLLRKELTIIDPLKLDENYTVITYPSGFEKFFAYRDFLVFNKDKKLISAASSTWTLIDTNTRKLSKIPDKILEIGTPKELKFLSQPDKTLKLPTTLEKIDQRKVRPYDLDWNNHINNIILVRFMVEGMKSKGLEDQQISKLLIHFKNEVDLGNEVEVYCGKNNEQWNGKLISKDGKIISTCVLNVKANLNSKSN